MTELKCPLCKTGNVKEYIDPPYYVCDNQYCPSYDETDTSEYDMLITTRKALDVAVDAMKKSNEIVYSAYGSPLKTLKDALEQINEITKGGKDEPR